MATSSLQNRLECVELKKRHSLSKKSQFLSLPISVKNGQYIEHNEGTEFEMVRVVSKNRKKNRKKYLEKIFLSSPCFLYSKNI